MAFYCLCFTSHFFCSGDHSFMSHILKMDTLHYTSMAISLYDPEYTVRNPTDRPSLRKTDDGEWIASDADGRSCRGTTPASAIALLRQ